MICGLSEHPRIATGCCKTCRIRWVKVTDPREALFNILSRATTKYVATKGEKNGYDDVSSWARDLKDSKIARPLVRNELQRSTVSENVLVIRYICTMYTAQTALIIFGLSIHRTLLLRRHKYVLHIYVRVHYIGLSYSSFHTITCLFSKIGGNFFWIKIFLTENLKFLLFFSIFSYFSNQIFYWKLLIYLYSS